jgi:HD-GYP domain-containing protein (c-di-GMP phosphodiesterase class II)
MVSGQERPVRLSELVAALSLATDLGIGQPMEHALLTCVVSVKAGATLGLGGAALSEAFYLALLRFIGCTADAHEIAAAVGGDEIEMHAGMAPRMLGPTDAIFQHIVSYVGREQAPWTRLRLLLAFLAEGKGGARRAIAEHCEIARMLISRMGLPEAIGDYVGSLYERWDGKGVPGNLEGGAIPIQARIVAAATDMVAFYRLGGWALAAETLKNRRALAYDPGVADVLLEEGEGWLAEAAGSAWEAVQAVEPEPVILLAGLRLDDVLSAFADFADLKSPFTLGHSRNVADLVEGAARSAGLNADEAREASRAALVHDLGKTGIPNGILEKPGPLSPSEWERVRLHPYLTERILSQSPPLRSPALIAGSHHERLDGSGYHRGTTSSGLSMAARLLAAADAWEAMSQARSYRPALDEKTRQRELLREVAEGRMDGKAVAAVLEAAGSPVRASRQARPANLTEREVEVLRLISAGQSNRQVAGALTISPKTVGRHVESIYGKAGVSTRASVALFAMQNGLL